MMQLRVISPADRTDQVIGLLSAHNATANLVVHPGAARNPMGDVVICDVARESASELLETLATLGIGESGSVALQEVALSLSAAADRAELAAPGLGTDAVVWQQIEQRTGEETQLSTTFVVFLTLATIIAGIGVLLDQPILIVGAMVVGPEFGPLAALCVGLVRGRPMLIGRALIALSVGFAIAVAVTIASTLALDAAGLISREMLLADRPLTDFIWRPDALSWVIGFLAGIAGMLSLTTAKSGALIGVLISVTTVPAAANVAVALAYGVRDEALGSLVQLCVNLAAIIVAGTLTLALQQVASRRHHQRTPASTTHKS